MTLRSGPPSLRPKRESRPGMLVQGNVRIAMLMAITGT